MKTFFSGYVTELTLANIGGIELRLATVRLSAPFYPCFDALKVPAGSLELGQPVEITISNELQITQGETK